MKLEASDRLRLVRLFAADIATPSQIETIDEQMAASARVLPMRRSVAYSVQPEGGLLRFVISDERVNRYGDIVRQDGWKLENFRRNPIALWGHDYDQPIGTWTDIRTEMLDGGKVTTGAVRLASEASEDIARIDRLARADVLRAVSPGFLNLKSRKPANDEERGRLGLGKYGVELLENELHEISLVSVGAQPGALKMSVEAGHITAADAEYIERSSPQTEREILRTHERDIALSSTLRISALEGSIAARLDAQGAELSEIKRLLMRRVESDAELAAPAYFAALDREMEAAIRQIAT